MRSSLSVSQADSSQVVRVRDGKDAPWREFITFPYGEEGRMVGFSADCKTVLALSSLGRDTTALARIDAQTGATLETIAARAQCDCGGILLDDDTKAVRAVSFNYARLERAE